MAGTQTHLSSFPSAPPTSSLPLIPKNSGWQATCSLLVCFLPLIWRGLAIAMGRPPCSVALMGARCR